MKTDPRLEEALRLLGPPTGERLWYGGAYHRRSSHGHHVIHSPSRDPPFSPVIVINGAHSILYSSDPEADRAFLRDVLRLSHVDVGGGWLIFGLPPAEVAVHPAEPGGAQELYLMCEDIQAFVAEMERQDISCEPIADQGWGLVSRITLPGGDRLGVYQPRHERPDLMPG